MLMGIAFLMILTYTPTYKLHAKRCRKKQMKKVDFFSLNLFHDFSNATRDGIANFQRHFTQISVAKILTLQLNQMKQ